MWAVVPEGGNAQHSGQVAALAVMMQWRGSKVVLFLDAIVRRAVIV